ncbi:MAG: undecaprenyldiphospho-muramoylpentapeptide beta-N-acetylglucosaminyltransferase [Firmicutes bacterium]|nr:undecaprenyldiphospho-muramoylpentapeptide beta-N-acetylglucosaminyltransferase [Bacillota bacterium]
MRIIITGGGTGGHIYPAITIAREFFRQKPDTQILFVGARRGLESELVPKEGFELITLNLEGIPRRFTWKIFKSLALALKGLGDALKIIKRFQPDLVIGTGGYVCAPMLTAAILRGIPTAIQEQNAFPGATNRILGKLAGKVFLAYAEARKYFPRQKALVYGNPVRSAGFLDTARAVSEQKLKLKPGRTNLLVFGGSQSARRINLTVLAILERLLAEFPRLQIMIMTGFKEYDSIQAAVDRLPLTGEARTRLFLTPYFYNMAEAYSVADLVLARAGAISLAEITCFGIPALLVPYPFATNNHQLFNARVLEKGGAARVILEADLTPESLWRELATLLADQALRSRMGAASRALSKPQAAEMIVKELLNYRSKV